MELLATGKMVLQTLNEAGYEAYFVGGMVRDQLINRPIYDIDIEVLGDFGLTYDTCFPEVNVLAKFIDKAKNDGMDIICQCEYGQSRSAGCAAAILEHYYKNGISIFADYRYYPNQLIFNKIYEALNRL